MKPKKLKQIRKTIPPCEFKCKPGCYECCCSPIAMSFTEREEIKRHIKKHNIEFPVNAKNGVCPYYSFGKMKCAVYPVRPIICRLFGIEQGFLSCSHFSDKIKHKPFEVSGEIFAKTRKDLKIFSEMFVNFNMDDPKIKRILKGGHIEIHKEEK